MTISFFLITADCMRLEPGRTQGKPVYRCVSFLRGGCLVLLDQTDMTNLNPSLHIE